MSYVDGEEDISIPDGSIKSGIGQNLNVFPFQISIPDGSIKSTRRKLAKRLSKIFQFQMVRLKVGLLAYAKCYCDISIPDGSIKSWRRRKTVSFRRPISIPDGSIKSGSQK